MFPQDTPERQRRAFQGMRRNQRGLQSAIDAPPTVGTSFYDQFQVFFCKSIRFCRNAVRHSTAGAGLSTVPPTAPLKPERRRGG
jgi:hypothetical protein